MNDYQITFYNSLYECKIMENLKERGILKMRSETDKVLQACLFEKCKQDPKYFFNTFLFTVRNDIFFSQEMPIDLPFMLFEYQEEMVDLIWDCIINKKDIFVEKSRQMSVTWVVMGLFLYGFIFHNHRYCIISRTANEVDEKGSIDSCFGRLRYMMQFIPDYLLPKGFDRTEGGENNKNMNLNRPDSVGSIIGKTANPDAGRGGTYNAAFMDEMAFMSDATSINKAISSATPCRIMNSTPHGEGNEYYRMKLLAKKGRINGITLHWTLHPFYTPEWFDWKTKGMSPEDIEQELEINYNVSVEGRVYSKFNPKPIGDVDFGDFAYDYTLPLFVSIDNSHGGNDPHAVIVFQTNKLGDIIIIDNFQANCSISEMAFLLAKKPLPMNMDKNTMDFYTRWQMYKRPIFIADPHDTNATWNDTSIKKEYEKAGIFLTVPEILRNSKTGKVIEEQIRLTKANLYRMKISVKCSEFISAIQNARYPSVKEGSNNTTQRTTPVHDFTSHYRTAMEYMMLFVIEQDKHIEKPNKRIIERANFLTGENEFVEV